jgi:hypothetical protein
MTFILLDLFGSIFIRPDFQARQPIVRLYADERSLLVRQRAKGREFDFSKSKPRLAFASAYSQTARRNVIIVISGKQLMRMGA